MPARLLVVFALFLLLPMATGCGDDGNGDVNIPPLTQSEADDLAQLAGIATGSDNGGWLTVIEASVLNHPPAPSRFGGTAALPSREIMFASWPSIGTFRDSTFARGTVAYNIKYLYTDTTGTDSIANYTPIARQVDFSGTGVGPKTSASDSGHFQHTGLGSVYGLFATPADSIDGTTADSLITRMTTFVGAELRYYMANIFTDYEIAWDRANTQFPTGGVASMAFLTERLNSFNPADRYDGFFDGEVTITFDGTQTPLIGVTNDPLNPTPQFRYRLNLKTGVVTRFP